MKRAKLTHKPLTLAEARKITTWFQKVMRLRDWRVAVWIQDSPPDWCRPGDAGQLGRSLSNVAYKQARVWVSNERCREASKAYPAKDPRCVLVHELLHAACEEAGISDHATKRGDFFIKGIERLVLFAYQKGAKAPPRG